MDCNLRNKVESKDNKDLAADLGVEIRDELKAIIGRSLALRLSSNAGGQSAVGAYELVESLTEKAAQFIGQSIIVNKCPVCGTFFVTSNPRQLFCCALCTRTYGVTSFKSRLESDEALACYMKAYKAMSARLNRRRISRDQLDSWRQIAKMDLDRFRAGDLSLDEFKKRVSHGIRRWERV